MDIFTTQLAKVAPNRLQPKKLKVNRLTKQTPSKNIDEEHDHLDNHDKTTSTFQHAQQHFIEASEAVNVTDETEEQPKATSNDSGTVTDNITSDNSGEITDDLSSKVSSKVSGEVNDKVNDKVNLTAADNMPAIAEEALPANEAGQSTNPKSNNSQSIDTNSTNPKSIDSSIQKRVEAEGIAVPSDEALAKVVYQRPIMAEQVANQATNQGTKDSSGKKGEHDGDEGGKPDSEQHFDIFV